MNQSFHTHYQKQNRESPKQIRSFLAAMVKHQASDLYLTVNSPAALNIQGELKRLGQTELTADVLQAWVRQLLTDQEHQIYMKEREINKGLSIEGIGRFRLNAYFQRGSVSMVIRYIRANVLNPDSLKIPIVLKSLIMQRSGLLLFVGATGAGKSTSMASLLEYRNQRVGGHILTIEDPIEFTFTHGKSIISQREVGTDTLSYHNAMREAMREAPSIIMVGEIRDTETMEAVMGFADTGHLALSTLHATNTIQALERMLYLYPSNQKQRVLMDLSLNLKGIIAQRLVRGLDNQRHLTTEILINTPYVAELIRKGDFQALPEVLAKGSSDGMQTFDQSLYQHYQDGIISREDAMDHATSRNNMLHQVSFNAPTHQKNSQSQDSLPDLV
ncbi:MAG TPA: PilT/PilU family type 4a pilus ATPase [Thiothrix sp.]|nr:PilT/PilU family type 4a pilus ATPase [Thiothrix sp.]